ncbi:hypothetical protein [Anatilimnocola floriformis]|uniref:hypothetical protein n=1 Tax=Anatilimnocola floriformis TaxID=2948575 RepID=UPI0020C40A30|nr:hypothetical protein [Anatilimnocola floriformis]
MQWVPSPSLRSLVIIAFLIGLPILALPWVSKQIDVALYGGSKSNVPDLVISTDQNTAPQRAHQPLQIDGVSPARFDESLVEREPQRPREGAGLDAVASAPPLSMPPSFASRMPAQQNNLARDPQLEPFAYVQQVRQKLEQLGAQYVVLEELDAGQRYRFSVQMQVSPRMPQVRPFEAVAADPAAAARTVLSDVETWRTAALPAATLQR